MQFSGINTTAMAINEDFLSRLEEMLNREAQWPKVYMFKFIVLNNNRDYAILQEIFSEGAELQVRNSTGDKYLSVTAREMMISTAEVMVKYRKAAAIEGIVSL